MAWYDDDPSLMLLVELTIDMMNITNKKKGLKEERRKRTRDYWVGHNGEGNTWSHINDTMLILNLNN